MAGEVELYQQIADLTLPECAKCLRPYSCCDELYCEMAIEIAREEYDIELPRTDHPTLPLMGATGCTAAPHLRPLCSLHTCAISSLGCKPGDEAWTEKYFALRQQIEDCDG